MKKGIKLTRKEKLFLSRHGYDPTIHLRVKRLTNRIEFLNIVTNEVIRLLPDEQL